MARIRSREEKIDRINDVLPRIKSMLSECALCGNRCLADRPAGRIGVCDALPADPLRLRYSSFTLHFGEEPMLVGRGGSGTVFFTHCNLKCVFCQNHQISHAGMGSEIDHETLARIFLALQNDGAENINLVTPTHYIHPILAGLRVAYEAGLDIPLVYNTNGFDAIELLLLLDGIVDVYLPDMKYMEKDVARKYSRGADYPATAKAAIKEMYRQTGPLACEDGVAIRGTIIRHLILPDNLAGSYEFLLWLKDENMTDVTVGLMSQYSPQYRAAEYPEIARTISKREYVDVVRFALDQGFENVLTQGLDSRDLYLPDFNNDEPFKR